MRSAGEDPDGGARRQPQRGDGGGGDGVRDPRQLAQRYRNLTSGARIIAVMKYPIALLPVLALAACYSAPPPPPLTPNPPGGVYRATGTEPFWGLTIDDRQMVFTQPDAQPLSQPTPKVIVGFAGEIYQTPRLNVN